MAPKILSSDKVKPLFDIAESQPFLLRELTLLERSIVKHWVHFYKTKIEGRSNPPSQYRDDFIKYLTSRGFSSSQLRDEKGKRTQLHFQNLFTANPSITLLPALFRITGLHVHLSDDELKAAFREVVKMHKEKTGKYPGWQDFAEYSKQRLFLKETGVIVPSPLRYQKRASSQNPGRKSNGMATLYSMYFDIPEEISFEDFESIEQKHEFTVDDLVDNLRRVQKWMDEQTVDSSIALTPSRVDIENYARTFEDGVPWNVYESWIYHGTNLKGVEPADCERSLEWLRQQIGIEDDKSFIRRPISNPRGYWTQQRIFNNYCEAWRCHNPRGYRPSSKILKDPPVQKDLEAMTRVKATLTAKHGELDPAQCEALGVPCVQVPSVSTIRERYPGGFQKLLKDIENRFCPNGGIGFSSKVQLTRMAKTHLGKNVPDRFAPIAVVNASRALTR
ncbi:MAG: hypothetical protein U0R17_06220 [Acidimicrobiia bacterium]